MSETAIKTETQDNGGVVKTEKEVKEKDGKQRSVSFNRDVHVKRFGKPRERGTSVQPPIIRKEPFTHLSELELIEEANKVIAQAQSVTCTADHPPEKFFSLPHRRKLKDDRSGRRNSDDGSTPEENEKTPLGRSISDVNPKRRKERTSLSTLFRRAQKSKSPDAPVVISTKPTVVVKRSKSDVSDLKSNTDLTKTKPIRKRSGSETEEFLKSLRNKKSQLSPIIESSPREDYFKKTSPLDLLQHNKYSEKQVNQPDVHLSIDSKKVNPIEKPPRYKSDNNEQKAPTHNKKGKSSEKEQSPPITVTPKRKTEVTKTFLLEQIDSNVSTKESSSDIKDKIKDSIRKIEDNVYANKEMKHSSQQPPEKPPLTRGHTVGHIVRILKEDQQITPSKSHLISPPNSTNINQPFSYTKPSTSPDPNLFVRNTSPDRVHTPVNKMNDKGVVYAQVVRDNGDHRPHFPKQTMHKTFSPSRDKYASFSDEDEGLGCEERHKYSSERIPHFNYKSKNNDVNCNFKDGFNIKESPIRPRFREYKLMSFEDAEPTYANGYADKANDLNIPIEDFRGRADGMDTKKKVFESGTKVDLDFNELSHRRELLESRLNARRFDRDREKISFNEPISKYLAENDPIYEAEKRMKQTEKYVNDTVKYYRHTLERDGIESTMTEDYKYDSDSHKIKYNTESRTYHKAPKDEFVDDLRPVRYKDERKIFPPEPEYEPPSLESNPGKLIASPDEYKEKKYRAKKHFISNHDLLQGGQKYKVKENYFGKRKGHYASNPEIAQEREEEYANLGYNNKHESYHNSLRRTKSKDNNFKRHASIRRHDSGDSRDYYREQMYPRRFDFDSRLVDSGIENDFRHNSSSEIHRSKPRRHESDEDVRNTSLLLESERQHTEDNYPSEQIYANGEYLANRKKYQAERKDYIPRDRSVDEGSFISRKNNRHEKSPSRNDDKVSAKPPKAVKKLSGLEKMKQLFSRDSSKKSKKEKEVQPKTRTRVLKSPEHLARDDPEYRRYTDPEPSDIEVQKRDDKEKRTYRRSREDLDSYRNPEPRESIDRKEERYRDSDFEGRFEKILKEDKRDKERREERRRYNSSERESDRPSDVENDRRKTRSNTAGPLDSPALAQRYRERRRLATPSPTPSPPRRESSQTSGNWFKSMDRLGKKREKNSKVEKESIITTEDESSRRVWTKPSKPLNSPAKNLRFFGDTDHESDGNKPTPKSKSKNHGTLRKTISNSSVGLDEVDHSELSNKSYSLSNLHRDDRREREGKSESPKTKEYYKKNLKNISEIHNNSENDSHFDRRMTLKPPISPYDRSRSHSSSKTLKGSKSDMRRNGRVEDRGSPSELRNSKQELREMKSRRRTPVATSAESSTEGDSSQQSQRSVVYLHATTVGDIPDPGRLTRNRSRDDVSSIMSSNIQVRSSTKSFSLFAPWTPRHYNDQYDVHYEQKPRKPKKETERFKKSSSTPRNESVLQKNKSNNQSMLSRRPNSQNRLTSSSTTLYRRDRERGKENDASHSTMSRKRENKKSQSSEILNRDDRERVSRSISIPKEKKAGWFKLSNKKKQETTRVR